MKYDMIGLQIAAILVSYALLNIPVVFATNVNIVVNGRTADTVQYDVSSVVNTQVSISRDPNDISWSNIKLRLLINSASLSHTISKVYIYKCKALDPVACSQLKPEEYDNFADIEFSWNDISQREGNARYPQIANLMIIVKLEGPHETTGWVGIMQKVRRIDYKTFVPTKDSIDNVMLYAKSQNYVKPIREYLKNFGMVPFNWLEKVVLSGTSKLFALGGSGEDLDSSPPKLTSAVTQSNEIDTLNKDFYFLFPQTSDGVASPVTLNLNPSFTCGDGVCDIQIGETSDICCYDCGCEDGYCDASRENPESGSCRQSQSISFDMPTSGVSVTDCSGQQQAPLTLQISNAPKTLKESADLRFSIGSDTYTSTCTKVSQSSYQCPIKINPPVQCGKGTSSLELSNMKLTITYSDGPNEQSQDLVKDSAVLNWNYDCTCGEGFYCDSGTHKCESEDAITLGITSLTSYLEGYKPGDSIHVKAKIFNPPSDTVLVSTSAQLNLTEGQVSPGTPVCSGPTDDFEYDCSIPFSITNYDKNKNYKFQPNTLIFKITYSDGAKKKTKTLSVSDGFYPISIPSQVCGDGKIDPGETPETCCVDTGCYSEGEYCDAAKGCEPVNSVQLSVENIKPDKLEDCLKKHNVKLSARVSNMPTDAHLDYVTFRLGGELSTSIKCDRKYDVGGIFNCTFVVSEQQDCPPEGRVFSHNTLNFTLTFPDGKGSKTLYLSAPIPDITVVPTYHCGQYGCEADYGENSSNCCLDCGCEEGAYCDYNEDDKTSSCMNMSDMHLVVDTPKTDVSFDTCERRNKLNVKFHIENAPSDMRTQFYGKIKDNPVNVYCKKESPFYNRSGSVFNCTMFVPREPKCSQGNTYTYDGNQISAFISFRDANRKKVITRELSASLPSIYITQNYETLYDITTDTVNDMQASVERTMDIANALMDWYSDCISTVQTLMWLTMFINMVALFVGGYGVVKGFDTGEAGSDSVKKWSVSDVTNLMTGISQTGGSMVETWMKYCEFVSQMYDLDMKIEKIRMEQIKMNQCIKLVQHRMDTGGCINNEESCFNSMAGCVDFDKVDSWANDLKSTTNKLTGLGKELGESMSNTADSFGKTLDTWYGAGQARLQLICNGKEVSSDVCSSIGPIYKVSKGKRVISRCKPTKCSIKVHNIDFDKLITITKDGGQESVLEDRSSYNIDNGELFDGTGCYTIRLYRDRGTKKVFEPGVDGEVSSLNVYFIKTDVDSRCKCYYNEGDIGECTNQPVDTSTEQQPQTNGQSNLEESQPQLTEV